MGGVKEYFSDLSEKFRDSIKLSNNTSLVVLGKDNIRLQVNGTTHIIIEVFYVIELTNNLLSIGQLQKRGLAVTFQYGRCKAFHHEKGLIINTKMSENRMFKQHFNLYRQCASTQSLRTKCSLGIVDIGT